MTFSEKLRFHLLCGLGSILHLLGFSGLTRLGSTLGRIMWRLVPRRRELATNSIMRHLGKDREEAERILKERHERQIGYYKYACREMFGKDCAHAYIYSFSLNKTIEI